MRVSGLFLCLLIGVATTIFSWYGPWEWPAAPAFFVLETFFDGSYADLPFFGRAAVLLLLIVVNSGLWAFVAWLIMRGVRLVA